MSDAPSARRVADTARFYDILVRLEDKVGGRRTLSNAIALLSHAHAAAADPPSQQWLDAHSDRSLVRASGLWNNNHVEEHCDSGFLEELATLVARLP